MSESSRSSRRPVARRVYPSDVSNRQWDQLDLLLPADAQRGRHREYSLREIINAINYRWLSGCSWRMLPHDLPQWQTVYSYFRRWQREGLLSPIRDILISRALRMSPRTRRASRLSDQLADQQTDDSPSSKPLPATSVSERDTSSWSPQSSYSHSRS